MANIEVRNSVAKSHKEITARDSVEIVLDVLVNPAADVR